MDYSSQSMPMETLSNQEKWSHKTAKTNLSLMQEYKILPTTHELGARRVAWLQQMLKHPQAHGQATAAIFGSIHVEIDGTRIDHALQATGGDVATAVAILCSEQ